MGQRAGNGNKEVFFGAYGVTNVCQAAQGPQEDAMHAAADDARCQAVCKLVDEHGCQQDGAIEQQRPAHIGKRGASVNDDGDKRHGEQH